MKKQLSIVIQLNDTFNNIDKLKIEIINLIKRKYPKKESKINIFYKEFSKNNLRNDGYTKHTVNEKNEKKTTYKKVY